MTLTYPERVNSSNIELMRKLVRNGPDKHPGANSYIQMKKGEEKRYHLRYGDRLKTAQKLTVASRNIYDLYIVLKIFFLY